MAILVAPSAEPVFNNRQVVSGYSSGDKSVLPGLPLGTSRAQPALHLVHGSLPEHVSFLVTDLPKVGNWCIIFVDT